MKKTLGLYIHIPFCERKCNYCGFLSFVMKENNDNYFKLGENDDIVGETASVKDYFDNLLKEIDNRGEYLRDKYVVDTIFIGGGTPSVVDEEYIENLGVKILRGTLSSSENPYRHDSNILAQVIIKGLYHDRFFYKKRGIAKSFWDYQKFKSYFIKEGDK